MEMRTRDTGANDIVVCHMGQMPYAPAWELQKQIQQELITGKRAKPPEHRRHVMLLVEHPPVYTLGKSGDATNLLVSETFLKSKGATFFHIDRGGDITFHGPGQIVGYPILDLARIDPDIHLYLRNLEETIIRLCADYDVPTTRVEGKTGVWIGPEGADSDRKICAMGIRCSRWVTMHGFALNVNTDLSYFNHIVPCGIQDRTVTSLAKETGAPVDMREAQDRLLAHFQAVFGLQAEILGPDESIAYEQESTGASFPLSSS